MTEYRYVNIFFYYMQDKINNKDLFFIRHGDSMKNTAAEEYRQQRNLPFDWDLFVKDPHFIQTVTHNPDLIDCHLSPKGIQQVSRILSSAFRLKKNYKISNPI